MMRIKRQSGEINVSIQKGCTDLVDIRLGASRSCNNVLDESRNLSHDIDSVSPVTKRSFSQGLNGLAILGVSLPCELGMTRLGPVVLRVLLDLGVSSCVVDTAHDDLAVLGNTANRHQR